METIYLSLVYTGSWGYLFQKSPVSNGSPNCLFIIIFCHFFVSQDWVSPIHLHNCIILLQETVRKTEMNSVIIFPSNNRKRSNASCSHSFYVLLEVHYAPSSLHHCLKDYLEHCSQGWSLVWWRGVGQHPFISFLPFSSFCIKQWSMCSLMANRRQMGSINLDIM